MWVKFREDPLHESTEAEKMGIWGVGLRMDLSHELLEWLQEYSENVVDGNVPAEPRRKFLLGYRHASKSSHELPVDREQ